MPPKKVECRECDWEGIEDALDRYQCPKCGSRRLKTEGSRLSHEQNRDPPEDAAQGEDFSSA